MACEPGEGRGLGLGLGLGSGLNPGGTLGLPWGRGRADAGAALTLTPRLPFQVLLHVLFEHAVGYTLLALKEVEEISLLQPQVRGSGGLAGRQGPSMHRALPRGRPHALGSALSRKAPLQRVLVCLSD